MITRSRGDRLVVVVLAASAACTRAPELTADERAAGAAALSAWREIGLPEPTQDRCRIELFQVRHASPRRFLEDCGVPEGKAWGCLQWDTTAHFFRPWSFPVVVTSPHFPYGMAIVQHELMHALIRCSGVGPSFADPGDHGHRDARVWEAAGGAASVQARAAALLSAGAP